MKHTKWMLGLLAAGIILGLNAQNLVENSSFENGVDQWAPPSWKRPDGKIWLAPASDKANSQGAGGAASLRLDWTNKHICHIWYKKEIPLNGLKEVELSFWAKNVGYDKTNIIEIMVNFPDAKDPKKRNVNVGNKWNRSPKEWTNFSRLIQVPEGATKAKLCLRIHGFKSTKGTSWVDNVSFGAPQKKGNGQQAKK